MGLGDRLRGWLAHQVKAAILAPWITPWMQAKFAEPTFTRLVQEGYKANGAVFACVSRLATSYPEPPMRIYRQTDAGLEPLPNHPAQKLLSAPLAGIGGADLQQFTITYESIGGSAFWYKQRSNAGQPIGLVPLHRAQIAPTPGGDQLNGPYVWTKEDGTTEAIPADDIVHFRWQIDPLFPWDALAPLIAVAREVDTDNEATRYLFALLKNDAIPRLAIVAPERMTIGPDEEKRIKAWWQEGQGGDNRGRPALLKGGMDLKKISLDLAELAFEALRRVPEARITAAFGVPAMVSGLNVGLERSTYSNQGEARQGMTQDTLVPRWRSNEDQVTETLVKEYAGDRIVARYDTSQVAALQEAVQSKRLFALDGWKSGLLMRNEGRAVVGLPRTQDGDVFNVPMTSSLEPGALEPRPGSKAAAEPIETKAERKAARRKAQLSHGATLRKVRGKVAKKMETAIDSYFQALADRVVSRLGGKAFNPEYQGMTSLPVVIPEAKRLEILRLGAEGETAKAQALIRSELTWASVPVDVSCKDLPSAEELLTEADAAELEEIIVKYYLAVAEASWETWNAELGVDLAFGDGDPAVADALRTAGTRVKEIDEFTLDYLRETLQYGAAQGWSVDHLVRGEPDAGIPGIRSIVEETYKNRAKNIARTEMGTCQNLVTFGRYEAAGVKNVLVMDNGDEDDDEPCKEVNGTVKPLAWIKENPLEHPSCTRAFAAEFED